jgi:hypothetical protein
MMRGRPGIYRYVVLEQVEDYLRMGWAFAAYASAWSLLMVWVCDCPPAALGEHREAAE